MSDVWRYVRGGPSEGGNSILRSIFGMYVWWRTWAVALLFIGSIIALHAYAPAGESARMWGYLVGMLSTIAITRLWDDG